MANNKHLAVSKELHLWIKKAALEYKNIDTFLKEKLGYTA